MSAPTSRPVHPCVVSLSDGTRGVEHATWAYLTSSRTSNISSNSKSNSHHLPNLVTASNSTITIYSVDETTGRLRVEHLFPDLCGSVVFLAAIQSGSSSSSSSRNSSTNASRDALVVGFAGQPQVSVVQLSLNPYPLLRADCLLDLTDALREACLGAVTPLEQDMVACCTSSTAAPAATESLSTSMTSRQSGMATLACVLGGGVAVAALQLTYHKKMGGWIAQDPFVLPLASLAAHLPHVSAKASAANQLNFASVATGFGDVISCTFVAGYLEPVVVLLHTEPGGRTFPGRLGRHEDKSSSSGGDANPSGAPPMYATAISVGVSHRRAAILWCCPVSADAHMVTGLGGSASTATQCLVVGAHTILVVQDGRVQHAIAANGWARSTCPASLQSTLACNPMVKLALSLDGCALTWVSSHSALVSLRGGQLYVLQQTLDQQWTLLPLGQALSGIGEIETLVALPSLREASSSSAPGSMWEDVIGADNTNKKLGQEFSIGLAFAGSRLGNSLLMGYALESVRLRLEDEDGKDHGDSTKVPDAHASASPSNGDIIVDAEYERILRMEEEALYAPTTATSDDGNDPQPNVIPASDDDDELHYERDGALGLQSAKRQRLLRFTMVKTLTALDSLVNLGPLGPSCVGPLAIVPPYLLGADDDSGTAALGSDSDVAVGSSAYVFPCGFGSSGGIALATVPGRDDRTILSEIDCLDVDTIFSLPLAGVVLLCMSPRAGGGTRVLSLRKSNAPADFGLEERRVDDWCTPGAAEVLKESILLAGGYPDGSILLLSKSTDRGHVCSILRETNGTLDVTGSKVLRSSSDVVLIQVTPPICHSQGSSSQISFMGLWSDGEAQYCSMTANADLVSIFVNSVPEEPVGAVRMDVDGEEEEEDDEDDGIKEFYSDSKIVSVDLFKAPKHLFTNASPSDDSTMESGAFTEASLVDDDEEDLYGRSDSVQGQGSAADRIQSDNSDDGDNEEVMFAAVCRQSGLLEVFRVETNALEISWKSSGCGLGAMILATLTSSAVPVPRFHKVSVREMRFFVCGPSPASKVPTYRERTLCLALEHSNGDFELYNALVQQGGSLSFCKAPFKNVGRPSQEQGRHRVKLTRKGIAQRKADDDTSEFVFNRFHRFAGVTGQDGLFSASSRPFWIIAERGRPAMLFHRTRHAAPAGAKDRPVSGFCSGLAIPGTPDFGFMVLSERVGRVGTQRLTTFACVSKVFASNGFVGGLVGLCYEKITLGVTVQRIEFINDSTSSNEHPLYAMLVSREIDVDQSTLNSDGLSPEERERKHAEKEAAKLRKQVEADLGGFDMESEWVEEIERENCFSVDTNLGGAPPLRDKVYSLWIVDAASEWMVVDSFELDPNEHGLTMTLMSLTDFKGDAGIASGGDPDTEMATELFIAVGTGVVDHNGEDVASRGRVLLFQVKRPVESELGPTGAVADLALVFEKEILHGPVTTLSCLVAEGKQRLVIGAGADVNIEQWGNSKLTQVGFFRATMQIVDILMFKNFMLLSDAYDSLYFLVWRESDKSLTLLAKDYDPIPVYAAGLISRGSAMSFLCHDDRQNLQLMQYAPGESAARGGNKLVCRADFHLGTQTTAFASHFCRSSLMVHSATPTSTLAALKQQDPNIGRSDEDQKIAAFFGSTDGGLGAVIPLSEPVYWRLLALQAVMANALDSDCALSPRAWRLYRRTPRRGGCRSSERKKGVIDGDLVFRYVYLPKSEQENLASSIGSTVDLILDNILETQCGGMML